MAENKEIWVNVVNFESLYKISNYGNIKSLRLNRLMNYHTNKKGYCSINLFKNGVESNHLIHRLVAYSFLGLPKENQQVNHKNGIRNDNRVENLEWVTSKENIIHSFKILDRKCYQSKIVLNLENGIFYESAKKAAESLNLKYCTLRAMLNGQNPNKTNLKYV